MVVYYMNFVFYDCYARNSFLNAPPRRRFFAVEKTSRAPRYKDTHSSQIRWQHQGPAGSTLDTLVTQPISVKELSIHMSNDGRGIKSAGSEKPGSPHKPIFDLGGLLFGYLVNKV